MESCGRSALEKRKVELRVVWNSLRRERSMVEEVPQVEPAERTQVKRHRASEKREQMKNVEERRKCALKQT